LVGACKPSSAVLKDASGSFKYHISELLPEVFLMFEMK
jgi:hypothetical protein